MVDGTVLVTGATGFIGRLLVPRLLDEGRQVRVLQRRPATGEPVGGEPVSGDVTDRESLVRAFDGVSTIYNLAGVVSHLESERAHMEAINVGGVENVLAAARTAGSGGSSTSRASRRVGMAERPDQPLDESSPFPERARKYPYIATKRRGEQIALAAAAEGQDVVVACPAFVIGAGDVNRISTFVAEQYLRGSLRFVTDGGLSYVDVRDVVDGLMRVERAGEAGQRYILGSHDGNLSHRQYFDLLGEVSGKRRLTLPVPAPLLVPGARVLHALHVPLPVHPDELDSSRWYWYATTKRAIAELGYAPHPVREAVESMVAYLRERGMRGGPYERTSRSPCSGGCAFSSLGSVTEIRCFFARPFRISGSAFTVSLRSPPPSCSRMMAPGGAPARTVATIFLTPGTRPVLGVGAPGDRQQAELARHGVDRARALAVGRPEERGAHARRALHALGRREQLPAPLRRLLSGQLRVRDGVIAERVAASRGSGGAGTGSPSPRSPSRRTSRAGGGGRGCAARAACTGDGPSSKVSATHGLPRPACPTSRVAGMVLRTPSAICWAARAAAGPGSFVCSGVS